MKVGLNYLDGRLGISKPKDYSNRIADMPRWAFYLWRIGDFCHSVAWRFVSQSD